jgi:hypothetical protein
MKTFLLAASILAGGVILINTTGPAKADTDWWHVDYVAQKCLQGLTPINVHLLLRYQDIVDSIQVGATDMGGRKVFISYYNQKGTPVHISFYSNYGDCKVAMDQEIVPMKDLK